MLQQHGILGFARLQSMHVVLAAGCICAVLFTGCNAKSGLPPEEVLRRAILRGHTLDSASLSASVSVAIDEGKSLSGSSVVQAILHNGGTAWSATSTFRASGTFVPSGETSGRVTVLTLDGHQLFLKPESLQGEISELVKKTLTGSQNGWWTIGESESGQVVRTVRSAPAPAELDQAASMFTITDSRPPRRGQDGRLEYRLDVELSKKVQEELFPPNTTENAVVTGTLFIDAQDFTLRRSAWEIHDLKTLFGLASIHFDVSLQDFDRAPVIKLPVGSSATLPFKDIFATFSF